MDEILLPAQALAQGFISIADALKQGLSTKDRTTLYREAVSGSLPSCKVKKGSRPTLWVLKSALDAPIGAGQGKSYERLRDIWFSEMRNSTFGGKPYSENTIINYKWALENYWTLLGAPKSLSAINADNFRFVMGQFEHDEENRNDHYSSKMEIYKALRGFLKFLMGEGLKTSADRDAFRAYCPKPRYKRKKKMVEDYEIAEAILANQKWRKGRSTHDLMTMDLLLHLYGYAGLRREEAVMLRREDIFFRDRLIKVFGKNSKERFVTPHPKIWPVLESWFEEKCQDSSYGFLLRNEEGELYTKRSVSQRFQTFSNHFGKPIQPHALRRGFAVLMANLNMPLNQIQLILGHEDITTTMGESVP